MVVGLLEVLDLESTVVAMVWLWLGSVLRWSRRCPVPEPVRKRSTSRAPRAEEPQLTREEVEAQSKLLELFGSIDFHPDFDTERGRWRSP